MSVMSWSRPPHTGFIYPIKHTQRRLQWFPHARVPMCQPLRSLAPAPGCPAAPEQALTQRQP